MNYTFNQLRIFLEVVRHRSVTKASEELHMTQPAVSIQLKNFQNQFDIPLTEIIGRKLFVTDFGRSIAEIAENVLQEAEAIHFKTKDYSGLLAGRLRISAASTGKYVIPYFLNEFLAVNSGIELRLDVSNKTSVLKSLMKNEIDFALVSVLPADLKVNEEILLENKLYLVSNSPKYDDNKPLIYREAGSATRKAMDDHFGEVEKRKALELTSNEAVKQAVIAGLGNSILPLIGIKNEINSSEIYIHLGKDFPISTNWRLIWLKNKKLSPIADAYLSFVKAHKYRIIHEKFEWFLKYKSVSNT